MPLTGAPTASLTPPLASAAANFCLLSHNHPVTSAQEPTQPAAPEPGETSLFDQVGRTRESFMRLVHTHIDLLKAEFNDILGELKVLATQAGLALGIAFMTA